eukprot:c31915_g1_i1 orf=1-231(-)
MFLEFDGVGGAGHSLINNQSRVMQDGVTRNVSYAAAEEKPQACVLAMGRATPPYQIDQTTYTDFYFNITNCNHKTEL